MVDASKDVFINLVLQTVAVCCFVTTNAKYLVQGTAPHVLKCVKIGAHIASVNTSVDNHVKNATSLANGSASI